MDGSPLRSGSGSAMASGQGVRLVMLIRGVFMRAQGFWTIAVGLGLAVSPLAAQGRGGGRAGGFPQFTRQLAGPDVIARGQSLYDANCASCHAADMRGVLEKQGPNLLRSTETFSDK